MIPSSFLSSQQFADAHLCKYYSIFFSFGLHLIYSVSEHKKTDYRLLFTHYCPARHFLTESSKSPASIANIRLTRKTWHAILFSFADIYPTKSPHAYCSMRRFSLQLELLLFKRFFYLLYFVHYHLHLLSY